MKMSLIVQRYGPDIVGGAERLCRGVAEGLAQRHDVEVITTCARSYLTWSNAYPAGAERINGVKVVRFPTTKEREIRSFNARSDTLFRDPHEPQEEIDWIEAQGPCVPDLVDYVHSIAGDRDRLLFFTYLYYPTVHGIHAAPQRSVLVPTAHDEAPLYLEIFESVFRMPRRLVFNTRAERDLVRRRFPRLESRTTVIGAGIDSLQRLETAAQEQKRSGHVGTDPPVLLYVGRIEEGKGVGTMLDYLARYREESGHRVRLWLMGELSMEIPSTDWIDVLGFLPEDEKAERLSRASIFIAPSALESFAIAPLEAMAAGTPVLVNAASQAAVEHCRDGRGGLYYRDYPEFREALGLLLRDRRLRRALATSGGQYVRQRYSWERISERYEAFLGDS